MSDVPATRLDNLSDAAHCPYCCPVATGHMAAGWVFLGWSKCGTDQLGPCPYCAKGYMVEFPEGRSTKLTVASTWPLPWGSNGFWRGRQTSGVELVCRCQEKALPRKEARELVENLCRRLGFPAPIADYVAPA